MDPAAAGWSCGREAAKREGLVYVGAEPVLRRVAKMHASTEVSSWRFPSLGGPPGGSPPGRVHRAELQLRLLQPDPEPGLMPPTNLSL